MDANVGGRDRIARAVLAVVSTALAVEALAGGKRSRGAVLAVAALGFGFNATTCFCGLNETLGIDTAE